MMSRQIDSLSTGQLEVDCVNCKVRYTPPLESSPTHTVCPVCSNRQPYGIAKPASPQSLKAPKQPIMPREATEEERTGVLSMLTWQSYHTPHVADPSFPSDISIKSSLTVPLAKAQLLAQWEERWLESKTRPYKGEALPETRTLKEGIHLWDYEMPLREGVQKDTYTGTMDLPETFECTTCECCFGKKTLACHKCSGAGRHSCPECNATRMTRCRGCGGSGRVTTYHESQQLATCSKCGGRGWFPGTARYNRNTGAEVDPTCNGCWGRGQRMETTRQAVQEPCSNCSASGKVPCRKCDDQGQVGCEPCKRTGRVQCVACEGDGRQLHYVELNRKCTSRLGGEPARLPSIEISNSTIVRELSDVVNPRKTNLDFSSWPLVADRVGTPAELGNWCDSEFNDLSVVQDIRDIAADFLRSETENSRLQRIKLGIRQNIATGIEYEWQGKSYWHWALSFKQANLSNCSPLFDRTVALCNESLELWKSGRREEAVQKARFCLDVANNDEVVKAFLAERAMPEELLSAAKAQAWKVYGVATTKRAVAGATAAVKKVTGWVSGLFGAKKPTTEANTSAVTTNGEQVAEVALPGDTQMPASTFDVVLEACGGDEEAMAGVVRGALGLSRKRFIALLETLPAVLEQGLSESDAKSLVAELKKVGAKASVRT
jgi:ribosomal protein L7/L12